MKILKVLNDKIKKSDSKSKTLFGNISISFILKGLSMVLNLLLMPLYIKFFDDSKVLGVWFTVISLLNYICSFDIGIGNGIRNYLVEPLNEKNKKEIKTIISTSYIANFVIGIIIFIIFSVSFKFINWEGLFKVNSSIIDMGSLKIMIYCVFIGVIIHFLLNLINHICYAMQKSFAPGLITFSTNVIMLILLFLYKYLGFENKIIYISIGNIISIAIPYVIATFIIFMTSLKGCFVSLSNFKMTYCQKIVKLGSKFLYLQILTLIMFSTNEMLITYFTSPENVVTFQIYNRIFYSISTIFVLMLTPIWSAVKEAKVQKDSNWIKKLYKKINKLLYISIPFFIIIGILFPILILIWMGKDFDFKVNYLIITTFIIYYLIYIKVSIISNFVAGLERLKSNTIFLTVGCILKVIMSIVCFKFSDSWFIVIVINIITLIPYIIFVDYDIKKEINGLDEKNC